jgi:predicted RNase H-like HicB family nuclease
MADDDRLARFIRDTLQSAEQQLSEAKQAYQNGKRSAEAGLPRDEEGRARIVCRRHAEYRAVAMDEQRRPVCYDAENPDCQGCVEDIRDGTIETW